MFELKVFGKYVKIFTTLRLYLFLLLMYESNSVTHIMVGKDSRLHYLMDSVFSINEPDNVFAFLAQEQRVKFLQLLNRALKKLRKELHYDISTDDGNDNIDEVVVQTSPDCIESGRMAIEEFNIFECAVLPLEPFGYEMRDFLEDYEQIDLDSTPALPDCVNAVDLEFNELSLDYLNIALTDMIMHDKDKDILQLIPIRDLAQFGYQISNALKSNTTSWILYNYASYFYRAYGDGQRAFACARRAAYFAPLEHRDIAYLNMGCVLHLSRKVEKAAKLLVEAEKIVGENEYLSYQLGIVYAALGEYELSAISFNSSASFDRLISKTHSKKMYHTIRCQNQMEQALIDRRKRFERRAEMVMHIGESRAQHPKTLRHLYQLKRHTKVQLKENYEMWRETYQQRETTECKLKEREGQRGALCRVKDSHTTRIACAHMKRTGNLVKLHGESDSNESCLMSMLIGPELDLPFFDKVWPSEPECAVYGFFLPDEIEYSMNVVPLEHVGKSFWIDVPDSLVFDALEAKEKREPSECKVPDFSEIDGDIKKLFKLVNESITRFVDQYPDLIPDYTILQDETFTLSQSSTIPMWVNREKRKFYKGCCVTDMDSLMSNSLDFPLQVRAVEKLGTILSMEEEGRFANDESARMHIQSLYWRAVGNITKSFDCTVSALIHMIDSDALQVRAAPWSNLIGLLQQVGNVKLAHQVTERLLIITSPYEATTHYLRAQNIARTHSLENGALAEFVQALAQQENFFQAYDALRNLRCSRFLDWKRTPTNWDAAGGSSRKSRLKDGVTRSNKDMDMLLSQDSIRDAFVTKGLGRTKGLTAFLGARFRTIRL